MKILVSLLCLAPTLSLAATLLSVDTDAVEYEHSADKVLFADTVYQPMNQHADVTWEDTSKYATIQYFLAFVWVMMLASLPLVVPTVNKKRPTKSQLIVGGTMLVVFFGGLYLFTNIILFQSVHFKKIRPLTIVECMYFMSQVITTVGYGDITPAKVRGQVFVGLYVLGALFIISMVVADVINQVMESADRYKRKIAASRVAATELATRELNVGDSVEIVKDDPSQNEGKSFAGKKGKVTAKDEKSEGESPTFKVKLSEDGSEITCNRDQLMPELSEEEKNKIPKTPKASVGSMDQMLSIGEAQKPSTASLMTALAVFGGIDMIWVAFFSLHPGEGKNVFQCVYMSVITLSSVGFGWFTPVTEEGMIFAAFFFIFGCAALVNVVTQFTDLMVKLNEWEKYSPEEAKEDAKNNLEHHASLDGGMLTEKDFMHFCLLQSKCVEQAHLDRIEDAFHNLEPKEVKGKDGTKMVVDIMKIKKQLLKLSDEEAQTAP